MEAFRISHAKLNPPLVHVEAKNSTMKHTTSTGRTLAAVKIANFPKGRRRWRTEIGEASKQGWREMTLSAQVIDEGGVIF